ncbi:MAG: hypothetical protein ACLQME_16705 [Alphaproteobacteria bacterium]
MPLLCRAFRHYLLLLSVAHTALHKPGRGPQITMALSTRNEPKE